MILRRISFLMVTALSLCACADVAWERQGTDSSGARGDLSECRRASEYQAFQMGINPAGNTPNVVVGPGGPVVTFQGPTANSQHESLLVQNLTRECMEKKGYGLIRRE